MREIYDIKGMHCVACSSAVERVLSRNKAVSKANVSLQKERLIIEYDDNLLTTEDIIALVDKAGFEAKLHIDEGYFEAKVDEIKDMRMKLIAKIIVAIPVTITTIMHIIGNHKFLLFNNLYIDRGIQFITTLIILILGKDFFVSGIKSLLAKVPTMDTLIAISTGVAFIYSSVSMFGYFDGNIYFDSSVMIIVMVSVGKYLEKLAKNKTSKSIEELIKLQPSTILILRDGKEFVIDVDQALVGDIMLVKPGEVVALDGRIIKGSTYVDESLLTGETLAVNKTVGDEVIGGSINSDGSIQVEITKTKDDIVLSNIIKLVEKAQSSKAPIASLADKVSAYFVPIVIGLAFLSALSWYIYGASLSFTVIIFVSVLVIACPCALGLATPMAIVVATGNAARKGILIKDAEILQKFREVDTIVFDKTGTLTTGEVKIENVILYGNYTQKDVINICASAEKNSEHTLAKAIVNEADKLYDTGDFKAIVGNGIISEVIKDDTNIKVFIGNKKLLTDRNIEVNDNENQINELIKKGMTPIYVAFDEVFQAVIFISDVILGDAKDTISKIKDMNINVSMITGDNELTAKYIGNLVGISDIYANMKPEGKYKVVRELREKGHKVAMVGDGINDAISLAEADVAISVGRGTDVAIETADIILMNNKLSNIMDAINISQKAIQNIKQNLFWALFYNLIGIPFAMGVFKIFGGPLLNPIFGCIAMSLSSLFVVTNALRLRRI